MSAMYLALRPQLLYNLCVEQQLVKYCDAINLISHSTRMVYMVVIPAWHATPATCSIEHQTIHFQVECTYFQLFQ
jgi:hypothetical protein